MMNFSTMLKKYWPTIIILAIVVLGLYVRIFDYKFPYLRNIDSYAFTRQIEDVANNGYLPQHDDLSLAPAGQDRPLGRDLYVYIMAYGFSFVRFFSPGYTLFQFLIWAPALMAALMAIPMYYIGKILYDRRAGILAAFFIVFDISILSRTLGGDPDNDTSVLLFPLIAIALFLLAYKYTNEKGFTKKGILYTILAGIGLVAWGYIWSGFWFVIWLIAGFLIVKIIMKLVKSRNITGIKEMKRPIFVFIAMIVIFFVLTVPFLGPRVITETVQGPFSFGDIKSEENREFPNVYVSVAELQTGGGVREIVQRTNIYLFVFMIFSLVYLAVSALMKRKEHIDTFILLLIWFVGPLIATGIGIRFAILFSAPIAIGSAILVSKIFRIIDGEGVAE
ncbi:MAG: hypothetical protein HY514_02950 [Candidatus Aenigmarchaeota archaeon]|nr:hypothetical protein [Candidatus Aenigmarchaeota archaeon]